MSQNQWFARMPDNPNVLSVRIDNRPLHLAHNKPLIESGVIGFGGPTLSSQGRSPEVGFSNINGSVHLIRAESEQEVWEMIKKDPYAKLGVWDIERTVVKPFKCMINVPM